MNRLLPALLAVTLIAGLPSLAAESGALAKIGSMIDELTAAGKIDKSSSTWRVKLPKPDAVAFDGESEYLARMKTNKGEMLIKLRPDVAPMHVTSFIYLAKLGFFDGLSFHRVIPGFMAQGGCPLGTGTGSPGYRFGGEYRDDAKHDRRGVLSTANTGRPNTDGSQFFITFVETAHLDGRHTVYGHVTEGLETLDAIEKLGSPNGRTNSPVKIESVTIEVR
jgi:cyclophilin family peptidyl-prolyl cis-trans isomerase